MRRSRATLALLVCLAAASTITAAEPFFLKDGQTVVFFGDSITQGGRYVEYVDAFLFTRFPEKRFRVLNRGISSETISGTSEPDHDPRRPHAHDRFTRDITAARPDVVVACFGMNDGNYHPFEPTRFAAYQTGVNRLIDRTRREARAKLVFMTSPPFDPYRRKAGDPNAVSYGYKFPAVDYDDTLEHYSRWLLTLRDRGFTVADVHAAMSDHLRRRRKEQVSFFLAGDAVHPNPTGHWLMAQTLLEAWHAPGTVAEATLDASTLRVEAGSVTDLQRDGDALSFTWRTRLPMPHDPQWDARSIALERVADRLNVFRLTVHDAPAARYRLVADGVPVAEVTRRQLAQGLDLLALADFPPVKRSREVLTLVQKRRRLLYAAWRKSLGQDGETRAEARRNAQRQADLLEKRIRTLCAPRAVEVRLTSHG